MGAPLKTPVSRDEFTILFDDAEINIPNMFLPPTVDNHGNYLISLGRLCEWMGEQAEEMGVDVLPGFSGD